MTFNCFFSTYLKPIIPLLAAYIVYVLGKSAYFRQKEFELITERYLKEGLDKISQQIDYSLGVFRHNWDHSLNIIKSFRALGKDMRKELYQSGFINADPSLLEIWRDFRLNDIIDDDVFYHAHLSLDAFLRNSYAFFIDDLCAIVKITVEGGQEHKATASREKIFESYLKEIEHLDKEVQPFYILLEELQKLAAALQTQRFSFRKLKKFHRTQIVKQSISVVKEHFKDLLDNSTHRGVSLDSKN